MLFFQSFYNYRITEMYDTNTTEKPPSPNELIGSNRWRDVSTDLARFELSLMQLGKTPMRPLDLNDLGSHGKRMTPTKYKVFLYSVEQLDDPNKDRVNAFRKDLQRFLRLESPLAPFEKENSNRVIRPESINICDARFNELRKILTRQGKNTMRWIRDQFLLSEDVFVSDEEHFVSLLETWSVDPCTNFGNLID